MAVSAEISEIDRAKLQKLFAHADSSQKYLFFYSVLRNSVRANQTGRVSEIDLAADMITLAWFLVAQGKLSLGKDTPELIARRAVPYAYERGQHEYEKIRAIVHKEFWSGHQDAKNLLESVSTRLLHPFFEREISAVRNSEAHELVKRLSLAEVTQARPLYSIFPNEFQLYKPWQTYLDHNFETLLRWNLESLARFLGKYNPSTEDPQMTLLELLPVLTPKSRGNREKIAMVNRSVYPNLPAPKIANTYGSSGQLSNVPASNARPIQTQPSIPQRAAAAELTNVPKADSSEPDPTKFFKRTILPPEPARDQAPIPPSTGTIQAQPAISQPAAQRSNSTEPDSTMFFKRTILPSEPARDQVEVPSYTKNIQPHSAMSRLAAPTVTPAPKKILPPEPRQPQASVAGHSESVSPSTVLLNKFQSLLEGTGSTKLADFIFNFERLTQESRLAHRASPSLLSVVRGLDDRAKEDLLVQALQSIIAAGELNSDGSRSTAAAPELVDSSKPTSENSSQRDAYISESAEHLILTPASEFCDYVIAAVQRKGGSASVRATILLAGQSMSGILSAGDRKLMKDEPAWRKGALEAVQLLVKQKRLQLDSSGVLTILGNGATQAHDSGGAGGERSSSTTRKDELRQRVSRILNS
ncbi:MAG: hypothetical protein K2W95_35325 [Candidatus Obscuribacterales bacterium]|nr:hypothetical protein [Candidatus Obscuribacterales bacterium]